jgi:hypothetical protein
MFLLRDNVEAPAEPDVWTARTTLRAAPVDVLAALTDPALIAEWAPVRFEIDGLSGGCLRAGSHERVSGTIAGVKATFDVEVARADADGLELTARGPVSLDVRYSFRPQGCRVLVEASVAVRRQRGMTAQVLRAAVNALLSAGALGTALRRLDAALCPSLQAAPIAA